MHFDQSLISSITMTFGLGLLCWVLLRRSTLRRRTRREISLPVQIPSHAQRGTANQLFRGVESVGAPKDVLKWQVELFDLSRQLHAELDTKMLVVQTLTRQCDQATKRLSEMIQIAEQVKSDLSLAVQKPA